MTWKFFLLPLQRFLFITTSFHYILTPFSLYCSIMLYNPRRMGSNILILFLPRLVKYKISLGLWKLCNFFYHSYSRFFFSLLFLLFTYFILRTLQYIGKSLWIENRVIKQILIGWKCISIRQFLRETCT